jgi:hypothetical protein
VSPIIPLRKNWLPSLVKNLEPLVEMVGMAETMPNRKLKRMESSMLSCCREWWPREKWKSEGLVL